MKEQHYFFLCVCWFFDESKKKNKKNKVTVGPRKALAKHTSLLIWRLLPLGAQGDARTEAAELKENQRGDVKFG